MKTSKLPFWGGAGFGTMCAIAVACLVVGITGEVNAQQYDQALQVPVTFYDFHSDRSNPEFEQPHGKPTGCPNAPAFSDTRCVRGGMVAEMLDADEKPVTGSSAYLNHGIRFWFRDWSKLTTDYSQKTHPLGSETYPAGRNYLTKFRPIYKYGNNNPPLIEATSNNEWGDNTLEWVRNAYTSDETLQNANSSIDTAFTNRVIKATLEFRHIGNGVYQFDKKAFFPLSTTSGTPNSRDDVTFHAGSQTFAGNYWKHNNQKQQNNFAYTMEMKFQFRMQNNLSFDFRGDDDVWLFINKRLVNTVDIGGIHEAMDGRVNLENIRSTHGLDNDKLYDMHLFYCERHSDSSNIRITTNFLSAKVTDIIFTVDGGNMQAGKNKKVTGTVMTVDGELEDFTKGTFTWEPRDSLGANTTGGSNPTLTVKTPTGSADVSKSNTVNVYAEKAYTWVILKACYKDPNSPNAFCKDTTMWVGPGDPSKVWIEDRQDSIANTTDGLNRLRNAQRINPITINQVNFVENFYGIVRDQFGNWYSRAGTGTGWSNRIINWTTQLAAIATAKTPTDSATFQNPASNGNVAKSTRGQGRADRGNTAGRTNLYVSYTGVPNFTLKPDTTEIIVNDIQYTGIRLVTSNGTPVASTTLDNGKTINMIVGDDTTFYVQVYDPITVVNGVQGQWVNATAATWTVSNIPGVSAPAGSPVSITIKPTGPTTVNGGGTVSVTSNGLGPVNVKIVAIRKDPQSMRFFNRRGAPTAFLPEIKEYILPGSLPSAVQPYVKSPSAISLTAGAKLPIVSKLFSETTPSVSSWLDALERPQGAEASRWSWRFATGSPSNASYGSTASALSGTTGDSVVFSSTVAHQQYTITVTYTEPGKTSVSENITISVVPDVRDVHVSLEREWQMIDANRNVPLNVDTLSFSKGEEIKSVYAILRDPNNNYIAPSGAAIPPAYYPTGVNPPTPRVPTWDPTQAASTANKNIVYAVNGQITRGEGNVIVTGESGSGVRVIVTDLTFNKKDTVYARLLDYYYGEIKIVQDCKSGQTPIFGTYCDVDDINITTNDNVTVYAVGKCVGDGDVPVKCNNGQNWELVTVDWDRSTELTSALSSPPSGSSSWTLTPGNTGDGLVIITRPGYGNNPPLTDYVHVVITVGPPTAADLVILTPLADITAGKPIQFEVKYYNSKGEMQEWNSSWDNNGAIFTDVLAGLGVTGITPQPQIESGKGGKQTLYYVGNLGNGTVNATLTHDPATGKDIVEITIYNATENPHQIQYKEVVEGVTLTATSERFTVKPGAPHDLVIVVDNKTYEPGDTLHLKQSDLDKILHAVATDEFGNIIGDVPSNWTSVGTPGVPGVNLPNRPIVVYNPGGATDNGEVTVCAQTVEGTGQACIVIKITGVTTLALSTTTRDTTGCGYLNAIDLKFPKAIDLTDAMKKNNGRIAGSGITVPPVKNPTPQANIEWDSVTVNTSDFTARIWLKENHTAALQTGWLPIVEIPDGIFVDAGHQIHGGSGSSNTVSDGAAPVINKALLFFDKSGDKTKNVIKVAFSEKVSVTDDGKWITFVRGQKIERLKPADMFNIWEKALGSTTSKRSVSMSKTSTTSYTNSFFSLFKSPKMRTLSKAAHNADEGLDLVPINGALTGIENTYWGGTADTLSFVLENGRELGLGHYINIKTDPTYIGDSPKNLPKANNRKVPIVYGNEPDGKAVAIPNPAQPDDNRTHQDGTKIKGGTILAYHDPEAARQIGDGLAGGTVIRVPIYLPTTTGSKVRCQIKVYDLAGNLVIASESGAFDAASGVQGDKGQFGELDLYWNGYNSKAMKVSPGTYRMVVYISYTGSLSSDTDKQMAKSKKHQTTVGMSK